MNQKEIKENIRTLEQTIVFMRSLLEEELKAPIALESKDKLSELTDLRMLAKSEKWPKAVPDELICNEEEDSKLSRAASIIQDFIKTDLTNKKFLDFRCKQGHVPFVAASLLETKAFGYDTENQNWDHFDKLDNLKYTTDFSEIKNNGPYDIILINDILDHHETDLKLVKSVLANNGKIYMRCHPWTSRHATHLYKELNRAYLHLVFSEDELYGMGLMGTKTNKWIDPLPTYKKIIAEAGLFIATEDYITHPVEIFFTHEPHVLRRIKEKWSESENSDLANGLAFPRSAMELQFVDFVLVLL